MENFISGNVRKIICSTGSGFCVAVFKVKDTNFDEGKEYIGKCAIITGVFIKLELDTDYILHGNFADNSKYGYQFNTSSYEVKIPTDVDGIVVYLSSGIFKGIGIKTAKKLTELYKEKTLEVLKNDSSDIPTTVLSNRRLLDLRSKLKEIGKEEETIMYLSSLGFTTKESLNLVSKYMGNITNIIESDIYILKDDIKFDKLDGIFLKKNEEKSKNRIYALIEFVTNEICIKTGNTVALIENIYINVNRYFSKNINTSDFKMYLNDLVSLKRIYAVGSYITLYDYYKAEEYISLRVKLCKKLQDSYDTVKLNNLISLYEKNNNIVFNSEQVNAIKGSIINNFFIISGGPGTGKTTIIKAILNIYEQLTHCNYFYDVACLAPTGRASKRLAESTLIKASTIHKFLGWNKETKAFSTNEKNKSTVKFIIVDESSMIDVFLMQSLLKALEDNVKIILVGDNNQLPSIAPGNVLGDLINCEIINKCILNKIYRAKEGSYIIDFAIDIKNQVNFSKFDNYNDFMFIESNDKNTKEHLKDICDDIISKKVSLDNFQVLIPMYSGINGIDNINSFMQSIFNPKDINKKELFYYGKRYRENDKVLQLVNDVENNVFNGDIGYIRKIVQEEVFIDYSGTIVTYRQGDYDKFTLAYAISIHKSQGSEYDYTVIILSSSFRRMLYNKLLYTGVSRAKKKLYLIGTIDSINESVENLYSSKRKTLLQTFFN
ncbi:MAG: AAA family ATPase [Bacilli bacterium]